LSQQINASSIQVRKLTLRDDTAYFDCCDGELNDYIWYQAKPQQLEGTAVTYLAAYDDQLVGFISLSMSSLQIQYVSKWHLPRRPYPQVPALMIGRLATDYEYQHQGVGKVLCEFAIARAVEYRDALGCQFVILNAKPNSIQFYQKLGFEICPGQPASRRNIFMYFKLPSAYDNANSLQD
jgi:GNAT superfamily N-acetyltransferase